MSGALAALALWSGLLHPGESRHARGDFVTDQYRAGAWKVTITENRFSGEKECAARRENIRFRHGVLTFYFPDTINTANATFRVDWGDPHPAAMGAVAAAGLGAHTDTSNFLNPSNGEVFLPAAYVGDAAQVAIKPSLTSPHRVFLINGFKSVVATLQARGCTEPS